jgi:hypothetical protein
MPTLTRAQVVQAMLPSAWDFTNRLLYELCREHPLHDDDAIIAAKVLLIGLAYSASIERRRNKGGGETSEHFYIKTVAPKIRRSGIDAWIDEARQAPPGTPGTLRIVIEVHSETTKLFLKISGLEKRSLASKYLHFHLPEHFYMFDSRAQEAIRAFSDILPRASRWDGAADAEYRKFAEKCLRLTDYCEERFGLRPLPRQLDNLLLYGGTK